MKRIISFLIAAMLMPIVGMAQNQFEWRKATVYFLITDRFANGDTSNDSNYGRINDYGDERLNAATFHGGDFSGMLAKAREGYFRNLGVDVVWMTDVYEQIHGWMSGSGDVNDFPHYGYHGYYPLDYTQIDKNYGTVDEFRELVDELHSQGIRVMLGANLNDPGYPTLLDAVHYGFAPTGNLTADEAAKHNPEWSYSEWAGGMKDWPEWWTREWLRMSDEGWNEADPLETTLYGLPDFKTEKEEAVAIPMFLKEKWKKEGHGNDRWVNPSAVGLRADRHWSPAEYVIAWIASWVEEFGIDGFRCDIVEYVHLPRWKQLNEACNAALNRWREKHPEDSASKWTDRFYMTGDFDNASIDYKPEYADAGFSSMVNCSFPKHGDMDAIVNVWQMYADSVQTYADWHPFSYLNNSYNRDADFDNMYDCATSLLMSPGAVQIFYGDESGRRASEGPKKNVDSDQSFRSDMNWDETDAALLEHFKRLGAIRQSHPAIGRGRQVTIDSHTCARIADSDTVVIRVRPELGTTINVGGMFPDGMPVRNLYSGDKATVASGRVDFAEHQTRLVVLTPE